MAANSGAIRAGRAFVEIFSDDTKLRAGLARTSAMFTNWGAAITRAGAGIFALGALSLAPFLAAGKVFADMGSDLALASQRTGIAVEKLSLLKYGAEQTGANLDDLERSIRKLDRSIVEAVRGQAASVNAFKQLGIQAKDLVHMSPDEQLNRVADAMAKIENPTVRTATALQLFGRDNTQLIPLLTHGAAGIALYTEAAKALGLEISTNDAYAALEFSQRLKDLWSVMRVGTFMIGRELLPALRFVESATIGSLNAIKRFNAENQHLVSIIRASVIGLAAFATIGGASMIAFGVTSYAVGKALNLLIPPIYALGVAGKGISAIFSVATASLGAFGAAITSSFSAVGSVAGGAISGVLSIFRGVGSFSGSAIVATFSAIASGARLIGSSFYGVFAAFNALIPLVFNGLSSLAVISFTVGSALARGLAPFVPLVGDVIASLARLAITAGLSYAAIGLSFTEDVLNLVGTSFSQLIQEWTAIFARVVSVASSVAADVATVFATIGAAAATMISNVASAISSTLAPVVSFVSQVMASVANAVVQQLGVVTAFLTQLAASAGAILTQVGTAITSTFVMTAQAVAISLGALGSAASEVFASIAALAGQMFASIAGAAVGVTASIVATFAAVAGEVVAAIGAALVPVAAIGGALLVVGGAIAGIGYLAIRVFSLLEVVVSDTLGVAERAARNAYASVSSSMSQIGSSAIQISGNVASFTAGIFANLAASARSFWGGFISVMATGASAVIGFVKQIADSLRVIFSHAETVGQAWAAVVAEGGSYASEAWAIAMATIKNLWDELASESAIAWNRIEIVILDAAYDIASKFLEIWGNVIEAWQDVTQNAGKYITAIFSNIGKVVTIEFDEAGVKASELIGKISHADAADLIGKFEGAKQYYLGGAGASDAGVNNDARLASLKSWYLQKKVELENLLVKRDIAADADLPEGKAAADKKIAAARKAGEDARKAYEDGLKSAHTSSGGASLLDQIMATFSGKLNIPALPSLESGVDGKDSEKASGTFNSSVLFGLGATSHLAAIEKNTADTARALLARPIPSTEDVGYGRYT